jgi:hypothetical protein
MDKKINCDENIIANNSQEEGEKMPALAKKEQSFKDLSLSPQKLNEITVKPKVKDGKLLLNKNNKDHRYIMEEEN